MDLPKAIEFFLKFFGKKIQKNSAPAEEGEGGGGGGAGPPDPLIPLTGAPPRPRATRRRSSALPQGHFVCDSYVIFHCPLACRKDELCYGAYLVTEANTSAWANVWNRIHRFDEPEALCLSQSFYAARQQLYEACVARGGLPTRRRVESQAAAFNWTFFDSLEAKYPELRSYKRFRRCGPSAAGEVSLSSCEPPPPPAPIPRPPECIRREGASEAAPDAVRQAVGGGCQSGWGAVTVGYKCR